VNELMASEGEQLRLHEVERVDKTPKASQPMEVTVFSHKTVEYYTPPLVLDAARAVLGMIDLDPASCEAAQVNVMATTYYTKAQDGLSQPWYGKIWLNPPYSKTDGHSNQETWSRRLIEQYAVGNVAEAILLVKAALGYIWFERLWYKWPTCFVRTRLSFIHEDGKTDGPAKQGSALLYFGPNIDRFVEVFRELGRVIVPTDGYSSLR